MKAREPQRSVQRLAKLGISRCRHCRSLIALEAHQCPQCQVIPSTPTIRWSGKQVCQDPDYRQGVRSECLTPLPASGEPLKFKTL